MVYKKADLNPKLYGITLTQELLGTISFYFPGLTSIRAKAAQFEYDRFRNATIRLYYHRYAFFSFSFSA